MQRELLVDDFVMRYLNQTGVDGLPGSEGAFLPCTLWLADCLASMGRDDEAREIFARVIALVNDVGLISEEYDTTTERLVGNFPQAFTHVGIINTAQRLAARSQPAKGSCSTRAARAPRRRLRHPAHMASLVYYADRRCLQRTKGRCVMAGYPQAIVPVDHVEPVPRRVRGLLGGQVVLDTTRALYLWEWPFYPQFQIPAEDVDPAALVEEQRTHRLSRGTIVEVGLRAGGIERSGAGRRYLESTLEGLTGTIRFDWDALDAWFEEDEEVFVHPRNPYARVDALRSTRRVRVELEGIVLAESAAPVMVFETGLPTRYYVDRSTVDFSHLRPSETVTACPYKGRTTAYWSVQAGEELHADLAWSYDFPTRQLLPIAGLVAFYDEQVDVFIDGEPQSRPITHFSD